LVVRILVVNSGSSSLKYHLFNMDDGCVLVAGRMERIGEGAGRLVHRWRGADALMQRRDEAHSWADHRQAFALLAALLEEGGTGRMPDAVGHRVVHGGERFHEAVRIDAPVLEALDGLEPLAPLHNPPNVEGIRVCLVHFPSVPQVAVFDTAFHQSLPPHASRYAVPQAWYREHGVRRYGFHGISHGSVAARAADFLGRPLAALNLITLHLGNGASAAAIEGGRSVDTSMGMTPLEGLVMGSRCGDLDPAVPFHVMRAAGLSPAALEAALNRDSGLKGLCGANDMREVITHAAAGEPAAQLALDIYCYRIRKYIGAYLAVLGRVDALVFTGGVGENAPLVRAQACAGLERLGIVVDDERNEATLDDIMAIQAPAAPLKILVARADEEGEIARQTMACIGRG